MARHLIVNHLEPLMSKLITPTPGRVVWYRPSQQEIDAKSFCYEDPTQPLVAHVARVYSDRMVNLLVIDQAGAAFRRTSVTLLQEDDERPSTNDGPFAEWMPNQKNAALKEDLRSLEVAALHAAVGAIVEGGTDPAEPGADKPVETEAAAPAPTHAPTPAPVAAKTKKSKA